MAKPIKPSKSSSKGSQYIKYLKYSNIALQMLAIIAAGVWAGWALDKRYESATPWFTAAGAMLGVIIATVYTIRNVLHDR